MGPGSRLCLVMVEVRIRDGQMVGRGSGGARGGEWVLTYIVSHPVDLCSRRKSPRTWTCRPDSCTSRTHPSGPACRRHHRPRARIAVVDPSMRDWPGRGGLSIPVRANLVTTAVHLRRPRFLSQKTPDTPLPASPSKCTCRQADLLESRTYPIDQIEYQSHRHAKLLEIQIPVIIHVRQIPDPFQLIVAQLAVLEHRCGLGAAQVRATVREG